MVGTLAGGQLRGLPAPRPAAQQAAGSAGGRLAEAGSPGNREADFLF
jgi:hypothetical protein